MSLIGYVPLKILQLGFTSCMSNDRFFNLASCKTHAPMKMGVFTTMYGLQFKKQSYWLSFTDIRQIDNAEH